MFAVRPLRQALLLIGLAAFGAACSRSDPIPEGNPQDSVVEMSRGYWVRGNVAIGAQDRAHWVSSITRNFAPLSIEGTHIEKGVLREYHSCQFLNLGFAGKEVRHVMAEEVMRRTNLYMFSEFFVERVSQLIIRDLLPAGTFRPHGLESSKNRFAVADVFVHGTDRPVHLMLSTNTAVLWNIQAAPDVKISDISIISSKGAAIVNAPEYANIRVLTRYASGCGIKPGRKPDRHWKRVSRATTALQMRLNVDRERRIHSAYNGWFLRNFRQRSEADIVGSQRGAHFLVGTRPTPEARLTYRPVSGNTIKTSRAYEIVLGTPADYCRAVMAAVKKRLDAKTISKAAIDFNRDCKE
ncbi:MAG: hypothetical protein AAGE61_16420 [Pseudomonadota bacterium]